MNETLQKTLSHQANHEFLAAHSYEAMALWCADWDYNGFARFFRQQADEEREHARRFLTHLGDRGALAELEAIGMPKGAFSSLVELAEHAQALEKQNSANIHACYKAAAETGELASLPFLLEFIDEQVEEESWAASMVTLTRRAECPGAAFNLDRHILKELGADE